MEEPTGRTGVGNSRSRIAKAGRKELQETLLHLMSCSLHCEHHSKYSAEPRADQSEPAISVGATLFDAKEDRLGSH